MSILTSKESDLQSIPILLIEDSLAITILLKEFLNSLGYYGIQTASSGKEGMRLFEILAQAKTAPVVFLDYNLPDVNANIVLPHILKIRPETKIIVTTALDKSEQAVKDVIMNGAYLYLQKPVRFHNIENAIKILEDEMNASKKQNTKVEEKIYSILKPTFVTLNRIVELSSTSKEKTLIYLKEMESRGEVISINNVEEAFCTSCDSVLIEKDNRLEAGYDGYHCLKCNNKFDVIKARKIMTEAFRLKVKYDSKAKSFVEEQFWNISKK